MSEVAGWVRAANVTTLVQHLAAYVGSRWDDTDQDTLDGLLPNTDADSPDGWFNYSITGEPQILIHLANDIGTEVVHVRVEGHLDDVLTARFDTLIDVL